MNLLAFLREMAVEVLWGFVAAGLLLAVMALPACTHDPLPDAPTVLTEPLPVECPAAEVRTPDLALQAPLNLEPPALRDAPGDDYLISRQDAERTITALRACSERIDTWKAWALP